MGVRRDEGQFEGPSLGGETVNTELRSERAGANKFWCRDGARHEFRKEVAHLIVGEASNGEVGERTIRFDPDEENGHTCFVDDVMNSELLRSFDMLIPVCYLVMLWRREELEEGGQSLSSLVKRSKSEN